MFPCVCVCIMTSHIFVLNAENITPLFEVSEHTKPPFFVLVAMQTQHFHARDYLLSSSTRNQYNNTCCFSVKKNKNKREREINSQKKRGENDMVDL